ncbi:AraC family transcriptional regulator [Paenibacillus sp. J2TS4]|uniref:AraC family transcriptional regulator n=1 Tax=Paenibacillus sp. J2TS4 TaxID=2807194 RepID=UPI001B2D9517|nr:AraC family transcriptional regulator [Paenibacillus sp. J2TS4]GIP35787.1 putative HTH-type transcriptional regulator YtdP [Paenibacillus sp. J2TS4]
MNRLNLYKKMVIFGCLLCIIPVLFLGFFSYIKSADSIQEQVNESNIHLMKQLNGNMEQILKTLDQSLNHVINSTLVQEALYRPIKFYDFQLYNNLRKELSHLQSFDTRVTDVIVVNIAHDWVVNNQGLYELEAYSAKDKLLSFMSLPFNSNWVLLENKGLGSLDTESYSCNHIITLIKKLPNLSSDKRGLAIANIPSCSLSKIIANNSDSREMMILDSDSRILIHPDETKIGQSVLATNRINPDDFTLLDNKVGQFKTGTGDGDFTVTYVRSDFNGWIYVSFTEIQQITKEAKAIGWFTVYVCLAIIVTSVFFVWLGSRRMYTPIRGIVKAISDRFPDFNAKKKDELQIINEHIEDLFISNSNLKHELSQNSLQMRSLFLNKFYLGNLSQTELTDQLILYGYYTHVREWNHLIVLTLQVDLLLFAANNIVEEIVPPENRLTPVIADQTQVTLIGSTETDMESFNAYIYDMTESIQQKIHTFLDLDVSIGTSLPFKLLSKAPRAYKEGLEALKHRMKLGKGVIIPYSNINSGKHTLIYSYPRHIENELIDSIKLADEERATELLRQWLDEVFHRDRSPHEYQISLLRLLNDLMIVVQETGIRLQQFVPEGRFLHQELLKLYVSDEIETWFQTSVIRPLIEVFRDRRDSQYHNLSEQIIDMIHNGYDTDLTLEECASRLHYNAFYLSSVFKKETNMSFSDYLSMHRFHMAKEWLTQTDMPIKDIAQKLRYNNPQNFIRFFRKQTGMTPGQYRTQHSHIAKS